MIGPQRDPADVPLLFPDPVIEYYLARVDRVAIRAQLQKTTEERLQWLQTAPRADGPAPAPLVREETPLPPARKQKIDMGADPAWFATAAAVPLLFPDPVIQTYLEDVDRGLIRENLKRTVAQRLENFSGFMQDIYELRGAALGSQQGLWEGHCHAGTDAEN